METTWFIKRLEISITVSCRCLSPRFQLDLYIGPYDLGRVVGGFIMLDIFGLVFNLSIGVKGRRGI